MKNKVHVVVTKIQACDDTTSIKAENTDTNNFANLEWFFVHFFFFNIFLYLFQTKEVTTPCSYK